MTTKEEPDTLEGELPASHASSKNPSLKERFDRLKRYVSVFRDQLKHLDSNDDELKEHIQAQVALAKYMKLNGQFSGSSDDEVMSQFMDEGYNHFYRFFTRDNCPLEEAKRRVDELIEEKRSNGKNVCGKKVNGRRLIASDKNAESSPESELGTTKRFFAIVMFVNFIKDLWENSDSPELFEEYLKGEVAYFQFLRMHGNLGKDPTVRRTLRRAFMAFIEGGFAELYHCFSHQDLEGLSAVLGDLVQIRKAAEKSLSKK